MGTVSFYTRGRTIYCSVSWPGNRIRCSTNEKTSDWSDSKERVKPGGDNAENINILLNCIETEINDYFLAVKTQKVHPSEEELIKIISRKSISSGKLSLFIEDFIKACKNGDKQTRGDKQLSGKTITLYEQVFKWLNEYVKAKRLPDDIGILNEKFSKDFQQWLWIDKDMYDGSVGTISAYLNSFINWTNETHKVGIKCKLKVWKEEADGVVLYPEELIELMKWEPKDPVDVLIRDMFIIGCMTCLRVSNLINLKQSSIINSHDGISIKAVTVKTHKIVDIKLNKDGEAIIKKYYNPSVERLFPELTIFHFNLKLENMASRFEGYIRANNIKMKGNSWDNNFVRTRYKQGRPISETLSFTDMISSHVMRATGITFLVINKVPETAIKKIAGFSKNSTALYVYVKLANYYLQEEHTDAWNTLKKKTNKRK